MQTFFKSKTTQFISNWITTCDHKTTAILYFIYAFFSAILGTLLSILIRFELTAPGSQFFCENYQLYNVTVTLHAILMIFFFVMPTLIERFGNFFSPTMWGDPDFFVLILIWFSKFFGPTLVRKPAEQPHIWLSRIFAIFYFVYFLATIFNIVSYCYETLKNKPHTTDI